MFISLRSDEMHAGRDGRTEMFKVKSSVLAAVLAGPLLWAVASMISVADPPPATPRLASQIDAFALMSTKKGLPIETYDYF